MRLYILMHNMWLAVNFYARDAQQQPRDKHQRRQQQYAQSHGEQRTENAARPRLGLRYVLSRWLGRLRVVGHEVLRR